jgi:hypothetical protein
MNSATDPRRLRALLVGLIWLCFLAKAAFYSSFLPLWEGPDEYAHFAFVQYLAATHSLPPTKATVSREVSESLQLAPVPWTIRRPPLWVAQDDFWRLAPAAREEREKLLSAMPRAWATQPAKPQELLYEAQQPPLAYLLFWLPYAAFENSDIATRVWVLRIAGSMIASLAIPLGFLIGARTLRSPWQAIGVAAVIASMPQLMLNVTHVSNEPLAVFFGTLCVLILISLPDRLHRPVPHALMLGIAFGCALLTKAYFLALVPAIAAIYAALWLRNRENTRRVVLHAVVTVSSALAIAGWWYARNVMLGGTLSGEQTDVAAQQSGISLTQAITHANWLHAVDFALISHIWWGGWSFLVVRTWMYRVIEAVLLAGLAGLALRLVRTRGDAMSRRLAICAALAGCFWIGPAYLAMVTYRVRGSAESFGYYAYCLVAAEAVCLVAGTSALLPPKWARFAVPAMVTCFALLEVFGVIFLLMPYYAGFTAHTAQGSVRAMHLGLLQGGGFSRLFLNLTAFKPLALSGPVLEGLCAAFLLAAAGIAAIAFFATQWDRDRV